MDLNPSVEKLSAIRSPKIKQLAVTIKQIRRRMQDPDIACLSTPQRYEKLSYEFNDFFERYTRIYTKVVMNESLSVIASCLYYYDQVEQGNITEKEITDGLVDKFFPENLKKEYQDKMAEMEQHSEQK